MSIKKCFVSKKCTFPILALLVDFICSLSSQDWLTRNYVAIGPRHQFHFLFNISKFSIAFSTSKMIFIQVILCIVCVHGAVLSNGYALNPLPKVYEEDPLNNLRNYWNQYALPTIWSRPNTRKMQPLYTSKPYQHLIKRVIEAEQDPNEKELPLSLQTPNRYISRNFQWIFFNYYYSFFQCPSSLFCQ